VKSSSLRSHDLTALLQRGKERTGSGGDRTTSHNEGIGSHSTRRPNTGRCRRKTSTNRMSAITHILPCDSHYYLPLPFIF